jgi:hypothetical protein
MRTTLNIEDEVLNEVKAYARARSIPAGEAASELIQRGLRAPVPTKWENGLLIFAPGPGSETITLERALEMKDAMEDELP